MNSSVVEIERQRGGPTHGFDATPLSQRWFGLDFRAWLPWRLPGASIEYTTFATMLPWVQDNFPSIFGERGDDQRWHREPASPARLQFFAEADVFAFVAGDTTIGIAIAHPSDWSTYYLRSIAVLPQYRGSGLLPLFIGGLARALASVGIERIEGDTTPVNYANILGQTKLGCIPTGMINTDRWGALVRFTRYLGEEPEEVFREQFCFGTWPRCRIDDVSGPERKSQP